MSIPSRCTVLVIGGGPGGSYTASVLAREGIDTVLLEAEKFPRYHIGESMLPSLRHYLKFIDLDEEFKARGFTKKAGAAFRMTPGNKEGWSDFLLAGGPENYTWNVIRSEADEIMFNHAKKSGAAVFDGVRVTEIQFDPTTIDASAAGESIGRPVSATYARKDDDIGAVGTIQFEYLVDASGRAGLLSTKYLKNRQYSKTLKNVAHWAYYRDAGKYGGGTKRENSPFFEALNDESGWAWFIPLHDGRTSVGIVRNQDIATQKKAALGDIDAYYEDALTSAPMLAGILHQTSADKRVSSVQTASDYSYSSTTYALPYARIIGDAGCFIDPFFSSGVHLALTGGLSAGTTIAASIRGDVSEEVAGRWHSTKVGSGFARFLLVVLGSYKQMRNQRQDVLSDFGEGDFDRAFEIFRPVIQGTVEISNNITQAEFSKTIDFLAKALDPSILSMLEDAHDPAELEKLMKASHGDEDEAEMEVLTAIRMGQGAEIFGIGNFTTDVVHGMVPRLERGSLTLVPAESNDET
ncbi:FAD/NAD(P)-binding domain-containing protein [Aspergillus karnatakaensis]|uniref:NAD(P)/FAD-dependent oxidoreductase n=1 Tax=Aspergillus karnatakaensis TaxID=1810916 RepID=UPI003CCD6C0E